MRVLKVVIDTRGIRHIVVVCGGAGCDGLRATCGRGHCDAVILIASDEDRVALKISRALVSKANDAYRFLIQFLDRPMK